MTFDDLCKNFNANKPKGQPKFEQAVYSGEWTSGSVNDLIYREIIKPKAHQYINDNGRVWIYTNFEWCSFSYVACKHFGKPTITIYLQRY